LEIVIVWDIDPVMVKPHPVALSPRFEAVLDLHQVGSEECSKQLGKGIISSEVTDGVLDVVN
jgi:hypothetical protein